MRPARPRWPRCSARLVFEFGPLWLVALAAPAAAYGPYWAALVAHASASAATWPAGCSWTGRRHRRVAARRPR